MSTLMHSQSNVETGCGGRWIERRAKLFEAGDYPDKGVLVTTDHLRQWSDRFRGRVPVLIEHAESPLEIGFLAELEAIGAELFGTLHLTPEANALIERSGARSLSLGISADLSEIREVSLVRNPRVPTAQLFADGMRWFEGVVEIQPEPHFDFRAEYDRLLAERRAAEADRRVDDLLRDGYATPAQAPMLRSLLATAGEVSFGDSGVPVATLVERLLRHGIPHRFTERVAPPMPIDDSSHLMLPEEADFYRAHFPDVPLADIAKRR